LTACDCGTNSPEAEKYEFATADTAFICSERMSSGQCRIPILLVIYQMPHPKVLKMLHRRVETAFIMEMNQVNSFMSSASTDRKIFELIIHIVIANPFQNTGSHSFLLIATVFARVEVPYGHKLPESRPNWIVANSSLIKGLSMFLKHDCK
jgi:hypothetical protein